MASPGLMVRLRLLEPTGRHRGRPSRPLRRKKVHALPWYWGSPDLEIALSVPPKLEPTSTVADRGVPDDLLEGVNHGLPGRPPRQGSVASALSM